MNTFLLLLDFLPLALHFSNQSDGCLKLAENKERKEIALTFASLQTPHDLVKPSLHSQSPHSQWVFAGQPYSHSFLGFTMIKSNIIPSQNLSDVLLISHRREDYPRTQKRLKRCKRDSQASIVGCQTSAFAPSARRLLHCFFLLKLGNNDHRLQQNATNCNIRLKRADEELIKS